MPRSLLTLISVVLLSCPAAADPTTREVLSRPDLPYGADYLSGIADGLNWANVAMKDRPLFCPPQEISITQSQYREILSRQVEREARYAEMPATFILLKGLIAAFPCKSN